MDRRIEVMNNHNLYKEITELANDVGIDQILTYGNPCADILRETNIKWPHIHKGNQVMPPGYIMPLGTITA